MLPPGHLAAGFLAGKLVSLVVPEFNDPKILALTIFFGFSPDLDFFYAFFKARKFITTESVDHRNFVTHAPLLYLAVFGVWYFLFPSTQLIALTFIIGTWSHFLADTLDPFGVAWLYPFSNKHYSLTIDKKINITEQNFFKHWLALVKEYYFKTRTAKFEIALIIVSFLIILI